MEWSSIIALYFGLFVLLMAIAYHRTLPYYSRSVMLRTGKTFDDQWEERRETAYFIMKFVVLMWVSVTLIVGFLGLIICKEIVKERPKLVSVSQIPNQSCTIIIADGHLYKLEYKDHGKLTANHPNIFLTMRKNWYGMSLSSQPSILVEYEKEVKNEPANISNDGVGKAIADPAEKNGL